MRRHKTDHRMAAMNTIDAIRAAEWHLYFPNQRLHDGLEPWYVPAGSPPSRSIGRTGIPRISTK